jgi:hypothetical protein
LTAAAAASRSLAENTKLWGFGCARQRALFSRRAGELLAEMKANKQRVSSKDTLKKGRSNGPLPRQPKLKDLGVSKMQACRAHDAFPFLPRPPLGIRSGHHAALAAADRIVARPARRGVRKMQLLHLWESVQATTLSMGICVRN